MQVAEMTERYQCNGGHVFVGKDVLLVPALSNFHAPFASFAFVDKDGKTMRGTPDAGKGDQMLACPKCKEVHPSGFDTAK